MTATPTAESSEHPSTEPPAAAARTPVRPFAMTVLAAVVAIVLVGAIGLAGAAIGRSNKGSSATVTVTGTGTVQGTPNEVQFTIGIQTIAGSAPGALDENDARVARLESKLMKEGVAKKDLQTSGLNIYENTNQYGVLTGFTVQDTLDVTMFNLKKAGQAIEVAARLAGNGIEFNGVTLSISDDSKFLAAARTRAMHAALVAARSDASGGGDSVGGIVRITDVQESATQVVPLPYYADALNAGSVHGVPLEAGRQPISVQVTVVYGLDG